MAADNVEQAASPAVAGDSESAPRRTGMAAERTYLAWLRTGLGALGLSLAVGRLIPALIGAGRAPFAALGVGLRPLRRLPHRLRASTTRGPCAPRWPGTARCRTTRWAIVVTTSCGARAGRRHDPPRAGGAVMAQFAAAREQVVATCRALLERGYLKATEGNVSVRVPGSDASPSRRATTTTPR